MSDAFILNQNLTKLEVIDAINERMLKAKSLTSSLLACNFISEDNMKVAYGFAWVLAGLLEELEALFEELEQITDV